MCDLFFDVHSRCFRHTADSNTNPLGLSGLSGYHSIFFIVILLFSVYYLYKNTFVID